MWRVAHESDGALGGFVPDPTDSAQPRDSLDAMDPLDSLVYEQMLMQRHAVHRTTPYGRRAA